VNSTLAKQQLLNSHIKTRVFPLNLALRLLALGEALILIGTGLLFYWTYVGFDVPTFRSYGLVTLALTVVVVAAFFQSGYYEFDIVSKPSAYIFKILGSFWVVFLVFLSLAFALKVSDQISRVWVFSWFITNSLFLYIERYLIKSLFYKMAQTGRISRRIILVGASEQCEKFLQQIQLNNEPWFNIVGIFDDRQERVGSSFHGYPILGNLKDLLSYSRKNSVDDIIVSISWKADQRINEIINKLKELPVNVRLCPDLAGFLILNNKFSTIADIPILDMVNKPLDDRMYILKTVEDKILGIILLVLLAPLMLLISLAIKLESKGPVLFRQNRYGFNNNKFRMLKFRSMYHERPPEKGVPQAQQNDPRVTPLGRILRKTSLDELPQLLNVLGGTMSIVGPRPHAVEHNKEYSKIICGYYARHNVKPGLTGWAQVNGLRGETDTPDKMESRVKYDVHYIENWSLIFDAKILIMTVPAVLQRNGNAY
jgi:Undecaprenyl-phosphate glucose phosphotransferase